MLDWGRGYILTLLFVIAGTDVLGPIACRGKTVKQPCQTSGYNDKSEVKLSKPIRARGVFPSRHGKYVFLSHRQS